MQITIRLDDDLAHWLKERAEQEERKVDVVIARILMEKRTRVRAGTHPKKKEIPHV